MNLKLLPRRMALTLVMTAIVLSVISLILFYVFLHTDSKIFERLQEMFYVDEEGNIPSWFSATLLSGAGLLFLIIGVYRRVHRTKDSTGWLLMGALIVYLSADEAASIHEDVSAPLRALIKLHGLLYYGTIILIIPIVLILAWYFRPFVMGLPGKLRRWFLAAAFIYIGSAGGLDAIGGALVESSGVPSVIYQIENHTEEFLEMLAAIMLIYILMEEVVLLIPGVDTEHASLLAVRPDEPPPVA